MQATVTEDTLTAITEQLAERLGANKYRIWFKHSTRFDLSDGYLKVGVPNLFIASWIENHFLNVINHAVRVEVTNGDRFALIGHRRRVAVQARANVDVTKISDAVRVAVF